MNAASSDGVALAEARPRFDIPNVLWHFGAVVAIASTAWLMVFNWEGWAAGVRFTVACAYLALYAAGAALLLRRRWRIPGGLLATAAVAMVPLVVYSFERLVGAWPQTNPGPYGAFHQEVEAGWVAMELLTIAVGITVTLWIRFPFVLAPTAFAAWYLSMDLAPLAFGRDVTSDERAGVSLGTGLALIAIGLALDTRGARRYAFWWHVFGFLAVTGALCWFASDHFRPLTWTIVALLGFATMLAAVPLRRATFAVFGVIGLLSAGCYFAHELFPDSWGFPFAVTAIGLAFMGLGMLVHAHGERWRQGLRRPRAADHSSSSR